MLTSEDYEDINTKLRTLKEQTGIEAVVVIIKTFGMYKTGDYTFEQFATDLFNSWAVGNAELDNGIMILVSVNDRKVRIEMGSGFKGQYDSVA